MEILPIKCAENLKQSHALAQRFLQLLEYQLTTIMLDLGRKRLSREGERERERVRIGKKSNHSLNKD